jgi:hypothetical protein
LTSLPGSSKIPKANKKRNYSGPPGAAPAAICSEVVYVFSAVEHSACPAFPGEF